MRRRPDPAGGSRGSAGVAGRPARRHRELRGGQPRLGSDGRALRGRPDGGLVDLAADVPDDVHRRGRRGAARNGVAVAVTSRPVEPGALRGAVLTRFLPTSVSATVDAGRDRFDTVTPGRRCAGVDYPAVVDDGQDFVLFWRTLPWDHAPGVLLLQEAGGVALRPDASPYRPADTRPGLLVAAGRSTWDTVRAALLPGVLPDYEDSHGM